LGLGGIDFSSGLPIIALGSEQLPECCFCLNEQQVVHFAQAFSQYHAICRLGVKRLVNEGPSTDRNKAGNAVALHSEANQTSVHLQVPRVC
jgi:hypothetical protein